VVADERVVSLPRDVYEVLARIVLRKTERQLAQTKPPLPELVEKRRVLRKFLGLGGDALDVSDDHS
jgi:hypothetical protein